MTDPEEAESTSTNPNAASSLADIIRDPERRRELSEVIEAVANDRAAFLGRVRSPAHSNELTSLFEELNRHHELRAGQLVTWKPNLKNRRHPAYDQPVIVVEMLSEPVLARPDNSGSPYFREPLDMIAGVIDQDGDFMLLHFDSRRFMPFEK